MFDGVANVPQNGSLRSKLESQRCGQAVPGLQVSPRGVLQHVCATVPVRWKQAPVSLATSAKLGADFRVLEGWFAPNPRSCVSWLSAHHSLAAADTAVPQTGSAATHGTLITHKSCHCQVCCETQHVSALLHDIKNKGEGCFLIYYFYYFSNSAFLQQPAV